MRSIYRRPQKGFTIAELIIVIIVIGILVTLGVVGYGNWRKSLAESTVKHDLISAASAMESARTFDNDYPNDVLSVFTPGDDVTLKTRSGGGSFCIQGTSNTTPDVTFRILPKGDPTPGSCGTVFSSISLYNSSASSGCGISFGKAYCWGANGSGQLGDGTTTSSSVPVAVVTTLMSGTVTAISTDGTSACAVAGGKAYCWGANGDGQLGNGTTTASNVPVAVNTSLMSGKVTAISTTNNNGSPRSTCAIADSKAYCWGGNTHGQLGNGTTSGSSVPVAVTTTLMSGKVTGIFVGENGTNCAIANGKAYCWGNNSNGKLGNGSTVASSVPVAVTTTLMSGTVTAISPASQYTCAVAGGKAYCWGVHAINSPYIRGHLGHGLTTSSTVPVAVVTTLMSGTVTAINAYQTKACAVADKNAYCWGAGLVSGVDGGSTLVPVLIDDSLINGRVTNVSSGCVIASSDIYCGFPSAPSLISPIVF